MGVETVNKTLLEIRRVDCGDGAKGRVHRGAAPFSLVGMAKPAARAGIILAMAVNATGHGRDIRYPCHDLHLVNLAVTHLAAHLGFQMRTMIPINPAGDDIDANPGNGLVRLCKLGELLDSGLLFRDGDMTRHAFCRRRKRHAIARLGIGVALLTFQSEGQVFLVTVRNGLNRWFGFCWRRVVGLHGRRLPCGLLCRGAARGKHD